MESKRNEVQRTGKEGRVARMLRMQRHELAGRLAETREIFARRVRAVDIHSHTVFSDGEGTVLGLRPPVVSWGVLLKNAQNVEVLALQPWLLNGA